MLLRPIWGESKTPILICTTTNRSSCSSHAAGQQQQVEAAEQEGEKNSVQESHRQKDNVMVISLHDINSLRTESACLKYQIPLSPL